jgi:hypothetical protein
VWDLHPWLWEGKGPLTGLRDREAHGTGEQTRFPLRIRGLLKWEALGSYCMSYSGIIGSWDTGFFRKGVARGHPFFEARVAADAWQGGGHLAI